MFEEIIKSSMKRFIVFVFCSGLLASASSRAIAQFDHVELRTTSKQIQSDKHYKKLERIVSGKLVVTDQLNADVELIIASSGYPRHAEFWIRQIVFVGDSVLSYEQVKDMRFADVTIQTNKFKSDSLTETIRRYFVSYVGNHIEKYLSKKEQRRVDFESLMSVAVRRNGVYNIVLFSVNGTKFDRGVESRPDMSLKRILDLVRDNHTRLFGGGGT